MIARILSLNTGLPAEMEWNGKSVTSSMLKRPQADPLVVHQDHIEGNAFASPNLHGTPDAVLYVYAIDAIQAYFKLLGRDDAAPGAVGETLTLDHFDESQVSVGDVFQIGEVIAQSTSPRIPCGKLNFRLRHPEAQTAMRSCGRSGVYLRILTPGKVHLSDEVRRLEAAQHRFTIAELYRQLTSGEQPSQEQLDRALANGAFPRKIVEKWSASLR